MLDQPSLAPKSAAISGQGAVSTQNAMAGDEDGDLVCAVCMGHRTHCRLPADRLGNCGIAVRRTNRNASQFLPDLPFEWCAVTGDPDMEAIVMAGEVAFKRLRDLVCDRRSAHHDPFAAALLQASDFIGKRWPIGKLQEMQGVIAGNGHHRADGCLDPVGFQQRRSLQIGRWCSEQLRNRRPKPLPDSKPASIWALITASPWVNA